MCCCEPVTGSAISIAAGQGQSSLFYLSLHLDEDCPANEIRMVLTSSVVVLWSPGLVPALFGIANRFDTKQATYLVIIDIFKNLKHTKMDAAFGLPCLVGLYAMKWTCAHIERRYPKYRRAAFFISVLRNALMIIIFTIVSQCFLFLLTDGRLGRAGV